MRKVTFVQVEGTYPKAVDKTWHCMSIDTWESLGAIRAHEYHPGYWSYTVHVGNDVYPAREPTGCRENLLQGSPWSLRERVQCLKRLVATNYYGGQEPTCVAGSHPVASRAEPMLLGTLLRVFCHPSQPRAGAPRGHERHRLQRDQLL